MNTILSVDDGILVIQKGKNEGKKIVLVGGVFDILHYGHIKFFEEAKKQGDILIVAIEPDQKVKKLKGEERPINNEQTRAYVLANLRTVDYVIILPELYTDEAYTDVIQKLKPDVIAVTSGDPKLEVKQKHAEGVGGKLVVVTAKIPTPSTTQLVKLLSLE